MMMRTQATHSVVIVRLDRTIQYAAAFVTISTTGDYRRPAFAGMTTERLTGI
jgi:hypothetical protein